MVAMLLTTTPDCCVCSRPAGKGLDSSETGRKMVFASVAAALWAVGTEMRGSLAVVLSGCGRAHAPVADHTACDPLCVSLYAERRFVSCGSLGERETLSIMSPFKPCLPCRGGVGRRYTRCTCN